MSARPDPVLLFVGGNPVKFIDSLGLYKGSVGPKIKFLYPKPSIIQNGPFKDVKFGEKQPFNEFEFLREFPGEIELFPITNPFEDEFPIIKLKIPLSKFPVSLPSCS